MAGDVADDVAGDAFCAVACCAVRLLSAKYQHLLCVARSMR